MNSRDEQPTYLAPDFRVYPAFEAEDGKGNTILMQQCDEFIEGRWEGFVTILRDTDA